MKTGTEIKQYFYQEGIVLEQTAAKGTSLGVGRLF